MIRLPLGAHPNPILEYSHRITSSTFQETERRERIALLLDWTNGQHFVAFQMAIVKIIFVVLHSNPSSGLANAGNRSTLQIQQHQQPSSSQYVVSFKAIKCGIASNFKCSSLHSKGCTVGWISEFWFPPQMAHTHCPARIQMDRRVSASNSHNLFKCN